MLDALSKILSFTEAERQDLGMLQPTKPKIS
jgi:hypothetical protein